MAKTARQIAASKRNLAIARSKRKRRGGTSARRGRAAGLYSATKKKTQYNKSYRKANYKGRGGYAKRFDDLKNSKGPFASNYRGKKYGKAGKRVNKAAAYYTVSPVALAVSRKRAKKRR